MLYQIFKFEIAYRLRRADTYIYFALLLLYSIIAVDFLFGSELGPVKRNAPLVIARVMGIVSVLFTMVTSMIMGVAILRDFKHNMAALLFVNPISKRDYLLGRFGGSFVVLVLIFGALPLGMMIGDLLPWPWHADDLLLPFSFGHYLQPFVFLIIPTLFFTGALFFVSGALSRKLMVVYTQGVILLLIYIGTFQLMLSTDRQTLAILSDPFAYQAGGIFTQFWTTAERNSQMLPVASLIGYNRLLWIIVGILVLIVGHFAFSFNVIKNTVRIKQLKTLATEAGSANLSNVSNKLPAVNLRLGRRTAIWQLKQLALFHFKSILKEVPFWAIVVCGMAIIFTNSISLGTVHGVDSYPITSVIVEELQELSILFFLMIMVFYSGELVWKERDNKLNGIQDALPTSDFINLAGKFLGFMLIYGVLFIAMISAGLLFQISKDYYQFEWTIYFTHFFVATFFPLCLLTIVAFLFQVLVNHKFIGHLLVVIFFAIIAVGLPQILRWDHSLYLFDGNGLAPYSAMNGYGHFLPAYLWFKLYWGAFAMILFLVAVLFSVRGSEYDFLKRWQQSKRRLSKSVLQIGAMASVVFVLSGCYIFYNTNILNHYSQPTTEEAERINYERTLKQYEYLPQPKIVDVNLKIELYPYERNFTAEGYYLLANKTDESISNIHLQTLPNDQFELDYLRLDGGASLDNRYEKYHHYIYTLHTPLEAGDTIKMEFKQSFTTRGFTESEDTHIIYNGTFFDNFFFPTIGYNEEIELEENDRRAAYGLQPKARRAKIDDPKALLEARAGDDGEEINFEIIIGTDSSQIALAPGYLQAEWTVGNRHYFHYKMDQPMSNFYSIVSARYKVETDEWLPAHDSLGSPVALEIYYHPGHEYNLDRMMKGMKKSFDYYSQHFSPYQYRQMRIMEIPGYDNKAQSFPNTVPFSEGIGFVMDITEEDVDMAFFVTAHELAHQWWGHQVNPAHVQGQAMISESLAQYAALMVLRQSYSEEMVQQFLQAQMYRYLRGRTREQSKEVPLALVESGQKYIHYNKGIVNLYAFQDYISEDSLNIALKRFVRDWNSFDGLLKTDNYPTTRNLLGYFRAVTPDSLQYVIEDLFETITLYENKTTEATYEMLSPNQYRLNLNLEATKYRVDSLGIETVIATNDWIDIGIYATQEDGTEALIYLRKYKITNEQTQLELWLDQKPSKAGIDPLHKLIDRTAEDNVQVVSEEAG